MAELEFESYYRKPGNTLFYVIVGGEDPFDFWVGRFYVGFLRRRLGRRDRARRRRSCSSPSVNTATGILCGPTSRRRRERSDSAGRRSCTAARGRLVVFFATVSFVAWALREVDICRKLEMGFHVPAMFSLAISAWVVLADPPPAAHGLLVRRFRPRLHRPPDVGLEHRLQVHELLRQSVPCVRGARILPDRDGAWRCTAARFSERTTPIKIRPSRCAERTLLARLRRLLDRRVRHPPPRLLSRDLHAHHVRPLHPDERARSCKTGSSSGHPVLMAKLYMARQTVPEPLEVPEPSRARPRGPAGHSRSARRAAGSLRALHDRHADWNDLARHLGRALDRCSSWPGRSSFFLGRTRSSRREPVARRQVLRQTSISRRPTDWASRHRCATAATGKSSSLFWALSDRRRVGGALLGASRCAINWRPFSALRLACGDFPDGLHLDFPSAARRIVGGRAGPRTQRRPRVGSKLQRAVGQPLLQPVAPSRDLLPVRQHDAVGHARRDDPRDASEGTITKTPRSKTCTRARTKSMLFWRWTMGFNAFPEDDPRLAVVVRRRRRARVGHRHPHDRHVVTTTGTCGASITDWVAAVRSDHARRRSTSIRRPMPPGALAGRCTCRRRGSEDRDRQRCSASRHHLRSRSARRKPLIDSAPADRHRRVGGRSATASVRPPPAVRPGRSERAARFRDAAREPSRTPTPRAALQRSGPQGLRLLAGRAVR